MLLTNYLHLEVDQAMVKFREPKHEVEEHFLITGRSYSMQHKVGKETF